MEQRLIELRRAHAALAAGCAFVAGEAPHPMSAASPLAELARIRVQGNHLRELDRLLSVLIDAVASLNPGIAGERRRLVRMRNTAHKLASVEPAPAIKAETQRLHAIGRISACLHHCGGVVHTTSLYRDVRIAEGGALPMLLPVGAAKDFPRLLLSSRAIGMISVLYREIGDRLIVGIGGAATDVDFRHAAAYIERATVAGDEI
ncbi:hypothetical protein FHS96_000060 [Sphingomonas zeicaulis]|uniref:hypothetical protein n=1 Tax=Sphingomonas zeicaulis TaxID=1632740 RepID=UPI003D1AD812